MINDQRVAIWANYLRRIGRIVLPVAKPIFEGLKTNGVVNIRRRRIKPLRKRDDVAGCVVGDGVGRFDLVGVEDNVDVAHVAGHPNRIVNVSDNNSIMSVALRLIDNALHFYGIYNFAFRRVFVRI